MSARIPPDAFEFYVSLGPGRGYQAVAEKYGVTKRAVVKHAAREKWTERLAKIQAEARSESDRKLAESIEQMRERHTKLLRAMAARVAQAIRDYPLKSGMDAIRAGETLIKLERLVAGAAVERTEISVEEITRQEIRELLVTDHGPEAG